MVIHIQNLPLPTLYFIVIYTLVLIAVLEMLYNCVLL